jgi:hypothetical protein
MTSFCILIWSVIVYVLCLRRKSGEKGTCRESLLLGLEWGHQTLKDLHSKLIHIFQDEINKEYILQVGVLSCWVPDRPQARRGLCSLTAEGARRTFAMTSCLPQIDESP